MGTQGHSSIETSLAVDLIKYGAIWIEWDAVAVAGKVTNKPELNAELTRKYRDGWSVEGLG